MPPQHLRGCGCYEGELGHLQQLARVQEELRLHPLHTVPLLLPITVPVCLCSWLSGVLLLLEEEKQQPPHPLPQQLQLGYRSACR